MIRQPRHFEVTEVIANGMALVLGIALIEILCEGLEQKERACLSKTGASVAGPGSVSSSQTLKRSASATRRGSALIQREGEKKMATAAYLDAISGARNRDESCPECGATPEQSHAIGCPNDEREG